MRPIQYVIPAVPLRIQDMPETLRPRELAQREGVESVEPYVLLAILLRCGTRGVSAVDLARQMLQRYGSLTDMAKAPASELQSFPGMGPVKIQALKAALELARRMSREAVAEQRPMIRTPEDAAAVVREEARTREEEVFWVLVLNAKNRLKLAPLEITRGVLNASLVHPREVFRDAIRSGAAAIVVAHNHPSGDPAPSSEDLAVTRQLIDAGRIVDIRVLDHVILGRATLERRQDFFSLRESGVVSFE